MWNGFVPEVILKNWNFLRSKNLRLHEEEGGADVPLETLHESVCIYIHVGADGPMEKSFSLCVNW